MQMALRSHPAARLAQKPLFYVAQKQQKNDKLSLRERDEREIQIDEREREAVTVFVSILRTESI